MARAQNDLRRGGVRCLSAMAFALVLGLGLSGAQEAQARPAVAVGDFQDPSGKVRAEKARGAIIEALEQADQVDLVPIGRVKAQMSARRVKARDAAKPAVQAKHARAAGADALVIGAVRRLSGNSHLQLTILDGSGHEVWAKQVPLERATLTQQLARRFAAAIAAAVGATGPSATPEPEEPPPRRAAVEEPAARPLPGDAMRHAPVARPAEAAAEVPRGYKVIDVDERAGADRAVRHRVSEPNPEREDDALDEHPLDAMDSFGRDPLRLPYVNLLTGVTTTWRTFRFCPEVASCEEKSPAGAGSPVRYSTDRPYAGFAIGADVYPFGFASRWLRGIGVAALYGRSLALSTSYRDAERNVKTFGSTQQRLSAELVYRALFYLDGAGIAWLGLRGGYLWHQFLVDENPRVVESRREGLQIALDAAVPLHRYVRLEARGTMVPSATPGDRERARYGSKATGWGGYGNAGLTSDFGHPEWHTGVSATVDYIFFGDTYENEPDVRPKNGVGEEQYFGFTVGARVAF